MTQIALGVAVAIHTEKNDDCPFCPGDDNTNYKTFPGKSNNSKKLSKIMDSPDRLTSEQGNARPKEGGVFQQSPSQRQAQPNPVYSNDEHGDYSCEAHHSISGNQAMKNEPIEEWICKSKGKIVKDTGYSINNADNGVWLPSIPDRYKKGKWGQLDYTDKYNVAAMVMDANKGQFHKGPHDITDPEDPFGEYHKKYPAYLKNYLGAIHQRIKLWADGCFMCEDIDPDKGPFTPSYRVHDMLDRLSNAVKGDLLGPPSRWEYFISKIARDYHKDGKCSHKVKSR